MPCDGRLAETHYGVDLLPGRGEAQYSQCSFGASGMGSSDETSTSRINELEGRDGLERNGSVRLLAASSTIRLFLPYDGQREWLVSGRQVEILLEHTECTRAGTTPCVNRLERITHRVDGGPL